MITYRLVVDYSIDTVTVPVAAAMALVIMVAFRNRNRMDIDNTGMDKNGEIVEDIVAVRLLEYPLQRLPRTGSTRIVLLREEGNNGHSMGAPSNHNYRLQLFLLLPLLYENRSMDMTVLLGRIMQQRRQ